MQITLCRVDASGATQTDITIAEGARVEDAIRAAGLAPESLPEGTGIALWGRRATLETALSAGDRVDLCAPLLVDPKEARRERALRQGDVRQVTCGRHGSRRKLAD